MWLVLISIYIFICEVHYCNSVFCVPCHIYVYSTLLFLSFVIYSLYHWNTSGYTKMCFGFQVLHQHILNQKTWPSSSQNKCMTITTMTSLPYQRPGSGQISQNLNPTLRKKTTEKIPSSVLRNISPLLDASAVYDNRRASCVKCTPCC